MDECGAKVTVRGAIVQTMAAFAIAFLSGLTGSVFAWPSYNVINFGSNETVLSEPMTSSEVSLLGSLPNIGAFVTTPVSGIAVNKFGRKYSAILFGLPFVIAWTILCLTKSVPLILVAMTIAGCGTGGQVSSSIFLSEIAHDSIRGGLMSAVVIEYFLGLLVSYVLGGYLTYTQVAYVQLSLALSYVLAVLLLKDSPIYLLQKGREQEAAQALAFYRQVSPTSKTVEVEISRLKLQLDPRLEQMLEANIDPTIMRDLIDNPVLGEKLSEWQFLKQSSTSVKALGTAVIAMGTLMLMGNVPMQVYAEVLFKKAVPSMDSNQGSIYLAIDIIVASFICSMLIDRFGRKFMMISTCIGSSIFTLVLGTQIQFHLAPDWFTAFLIYAYNFVFNIGVAVIPYILAAELFLPEVRGICGSIVMCSSWALNFITLYIFTPAVETYGFGPIFYALTIIGFIGAILNAIFQPETKGLSADAIQSLYLKKKKKTNNI